LISGCRRLFGVPSSFPCDTGTRPQPSPGELSLIAPLGNHIVRVLQDQMHVVAEATVIGQAADGERIDARNSQRAANPASAMLNKTAPNVDLPAKPGPTHAR